MALLNWFKTHYSLYIFYWRNIWSEASKFQGIKSSEDIIRASIKKSSHLEDSIVQELDLCEILVFKIKQC